MFALSHQCNQRRSAAPTRTHQFNDPSSSMAAAKVGLVPSSGDVQPTGVERAAPSDKMKLDRDAGRELMNDAAARGRTSELDKPAGSIFKSSPSERASVAAGGHQRQPSSDIFLRMSGDNQHNLRPRQHHNKHNNNSNNHLPFRVLATSWMMGVRETQPIERASFKILTRSSSSLLLALISHIVIISLILHQSPTNNQAFAWSASLPHERHESQTHPHRDTSRQADRLDGHLHTKSGALGSFMASAEGDSAKQAAALPGDHDKDPVFDRIILESVADDGHQRHRRQLANGLSWNSQPAAVQKRQQHTAAADCHKMTVFWSFLQTSYPALSSHLFQWANEMEGKAASDEQFLWSKSYGLARSIGHLLDQAERLVASQQRAHSAPISQSGNSGWLQRISSNPAYARLVQHFRGSMNKPYKTAPSPATATDAPPPSSLGDGRAAGVEPTGSDDGLQLDGEQMMAAPTHQQQQAHYGRVVHYPHEIGNTDNSNGMARTLDKLRLLSHHARQQQQRQFQHDNEHDPSDIESNRILSSQQDIDLRRQQQQHAQPRRGASESVDSARNNFVYGKVLLRPQHENDYSSGESRRDPLSTLRELASEQQRQLSGAAGASLPDGPRSRDAHSPDHYGRIIMSPPSSSSSSSSSSSEQKDQPRTEAQDDNSNQQHRNNHQPQDEISRMLDSAQPAHLFTADYSQPSLAGLGSDELSSQQKSQRVAINGEQSDEEEFDGVFHSGPLTEIEVRQLRSVGQKKPENERPDVELVTSASPATIITSTPKH